MLEGPVTIQDLWTYLPPVGAFSLFRLLFDTVLYETLFSFKFG